MTVNELIENLQKLKEEHGDVEVASSMNGGSIYEIENVLYHKDVEVLIIEV